MYSAKSTTGCVIRVLRRILGGGFIVVGLAAIVPYSFVRVGTHDGFGFPVYDIPTWIAWVFGTESDWHGFRGILHAIGWGIWMFVGYSIVSTSEPKTEGLGTPTRQ
jgi:hypothetical protein